MFSCIEVGFSKRRAAPVFAPQSLTVRSPADTTIWPPGENATALTQSEWTNNSNRLRKQNCPAQN
jgi:hypothetical protein